MEGIVVKVDAAKTLQMLGILSEKQVNYAIANALNNTCKSIQDEVRKNAKRSLTLRSKKDFILRQAAIIKFASVKAGTGGEASVRVGNKPGLLLEKLETGGARTPRAGKVAIATPMVGGARPTIRQDIPPALYVNALKVRRGAKTKKKRKGTAGAERFFVTKLGIFERGASRLQNKLLYLFNKVVKVPPKLKFIETAKRVTSTSYALFMTEQISKAVAFSGGKGAGCGKPRRTYLEAD